MKISTKIITGYGVLIIIIAALLVLELVAIRRMQRISNDLSEVNFRSSVAALDLMRSRDHLDEMLRRALVRRGDPEYLQGFKSSMEQFKETIHRVKEKASTDIERAEVGALDKEMADFEAELKRKEEIFSAETSLDISQHLEKRLARLLEYVLRTYDATIKAKDLELKRSRQIGRRTETATWFLAGLALIASVFVTLFLVRSITTPLNHLTVGTRRIMEGQFDYQLDATGKDEFGQLARDFNTMTRRLDELDQMKRDFVSHVSHELKAPLASIRETLQLMAEELPGPLTSKQRRLIEINLLCARRLSSMIGNLLDQSRMDAGTMEYELKGNDFVALVLTAMEEYEPQAREKSLHLTADLPESPLQVHCDEDRIVQVIGNVLGNAIKFSPAGGQIKIRVESNPSLPQHVPGFWRQNLEFYPGNGGYVTAAISDSGPGIPGQLKEKIFMKFRQLRQEKVPAGHGVGLGLAISRTIIQAHQGAIWVEDNPGGGSIFYLLLPTGSGSGEVSRRISAPI